jgi:phosphoesterase RecJ-like protein
MQNATTQAQKFDELLKQSTTILLVCHTGADVDALASLLALKTILTTFYPDKTVSAVGERIPKSLAFLPSFGDAINGSVLENITKQSPDLMIFLDFSQIHMASKTDVVQIQETIKKNGITYAVIDHHPEMQENMEAELYVNLDSTSTATNLHILFHELLGFDILPSVADLLLYGIIADTNRFKYKYGQDSQVQLLQYVSKLLEKATVSIEDIANDLERADLGMMKIVATFIQNTQMATDDFAYTSISEDDIAAHHLDSTKLGDAAQYMANNIISLIGTAKRGAVIYPHLLEESTFTVRFRSSSEHYPISNFAKELGGGGHAQSAAARVKVNTIEEAVKIVLKKLTNG